MSPEKLAKALVTGKYAYDGHEYDHKDMDSFIAMMVNATTDSPVTMTKVDYKWLNEFHTELCSYATYMALDEGKPTSRFRTAEEVKVRLEKEAPKV